ncbi:hypothetical protein [Roseivirga misakiensis]|uniref:NIPSNAP domain-containing protein n=1 Tax=Roseivirga misakiensis TaxID=1563681 RepID=A0A1E5SKS8_9BACT|nr:hypothetical protein [Roseivirga misakiensis]OEJ99729.1 hypothetical protein BFP71_09175 [Roseivirga misakiensis]
MKRYFFVILITALFTNCQAQQANDVYYKVITMRATPGKLLDLIDVIKADLKNYERAGIEKPYLMRHSQGDHWDLLLMYPIQDLSKHFSTTEMEKRRDNSATLDQGYGRPYYNMVSWQEESIVEGPSLKEFNARFSEFDYYHVEMFQALAGKQEELLRQREMENVYLTEIGRDTNLIFTKIFGGEVDIFTLGFYRDIKHFAESADIPIEKENVAAKKAGFESVFTIGSYLRSLLLEHHDTLAGALRND